MRWLFRSRRRESATRPSRPARPAHRLRCLGRHVEEAASTRHCHGAARRRDDEAVAGRQSERARSVRNIARVAEKCAGRARVSFDRGSDERSEQENSRQVPRRETPTRSILADPKKFHACPSAEESAEPQLPRCHFAEPQLRPRYGRIITRRISHAAPPRRLRRRNVGRLPIHPRHLGGPRRLPARGQGHAGRDFADGPHQSDCAGRRLRRPDTSLPPTKRGCNRCQLDGGRRWHTTGAGARRDGDKCRRQRVARLHEGTMDFAALVDGPGAQERASPRGGQRARRLAALPQRCRGRAERAPVLLPGGAFDGSPCFNFMKETIHRYCGGAPNLPQRRRAPPAGGGRGAARRLWQLRALPGAAAAQRAAHSTRTSGRGSAPCPNSSAARVRRCAGRSTSHPTRARARQGPARREPVRRPRLFGRRRLQDDPRQEPARSCSAGEPRHRRLRAVHQERNVVGDFSSARCSASARRSTRWRNAGVRDAEDGGGGVQRRGAAFEARRTAFNGGAVAFERRPLWRRSDAARLVFFNNYGTRTVHEDAQCVGGTGRRSSSASTASRQRPASASPRACCRPKTSTRSATTRREGC